MSSLQAELEAKMNREQERVLRAESELKVRVLIKILSHLHAFSIILESVRNS